MRNNEVKNRERTNGFTLVETLVAVTILLVVIVGPMTIAQRGMQSSYFAGEQITAIYLAQEAIEHFQELRDDVALQSFDDYKDNVNDVPEDTRRWLTNLDGNCKSNQGCDINGSTYRNCSLTNQCRLNLLSGSSVRAYGYGPGSASKFTRTVVVGNGSLGWGNFDALGGVPVTVTVSWTPGNTTTYGATRSVVIQTYIYDHYNRFEN
jgi:prepilin-type N-terminal cleavage/methylation domain-containing protein